MPDRDREYTTVYLPNETRARLEDLHQMWSDHPEALPLYTTMDAGLEALMEKYDD